MPAKKTDNLTYEDVSVFKLHEVEQKTLQETAEVMNVSRDTVKRIKKREAYISFATEAMERQGYDVDRFARDLIGKTAAQKEGKGEGKVDDNPTQMKAIERIGNIFGVDAPKEYDVRHGLAGATDEEIIADLEKAESKLGVDGGPGEPEPDSGSPEED